MAIFEEARRKETRGLGMNILLVDDEPSFRMLAGNALSDEGFKVFLAENGEDALKTLESQPIELVVSDLHMPVMDGLTFCRMVRERPKFRNLPFLFVSAYEDDSTLGIMASWEHTGFLRKTRPLEEMVDWIIRLASAAQVGARMATKVENVDDSQPLQPLPPPRVGKVNPSEVSILVVDDEDSLRFMLTDMLSKEGYKVTTAADGADAIDRLKEQMYDVMLLDLIMPNVSGFGVLKYLQEHPCETKVIVVTAYSELKLAVETKQHGAHDFIAKPFMRGDLLTTIRKVLKE